MAIQELVSSEMDEAGDEADWNEFDAGLNPASLGLGIAPTTPTGCVGFGSASCLSCPGETMTGDGFWNAGLTLGEYLH